MLSGLVAGAIVSAIGSSSGSVALVSEDWRLSVLQVTLGPVLEEVLFRGYLFAVLVWALKGVAGDPMRDRLVVMASATVFALAHCAQPGVSWLQLACIIVDRNALRLAEARFRVNCELSASVRDRS